MALAVVLVTIETIYVLHVEADELDDGWDVMGPGDKPVKCGLLKRGRIYTFAEIGSTWTRHSGNIF